MKAAAPLFNAAVVLQAVMTGTVSAEAVSFSDPRWTLRGEKAEITTVEGREAVHLLNAMAILDAEFGNGVIEFDLKVSAARGFQGVYFRVFDEKNGENFYIRPHQSGNPDANQYTPLFNGQTAWQLYYGPQFSAPTVYRFGEWMHVKVVVSGNEAEFHIDEEPVLHVSHLKNKKVPGKLILSSAYAPAHFAGFRYQESPAPEIEGTSVAPPSPEPGTIPAWRISSPFAETRLQGVTELSPEHFEGLSWQALEVEDRGYANLSRVTEFRPESDTTFAGVRLEADEATVRTLEFGYSDRVRVYFNDELIYAGDNTYRTRDYRFLGTIGLFDSVPLHLKKGGNELLFAVSESFGGWGVMARIENREGLVLSSDN